MRAARKASPETAVILLTAYGSVPDAVTAMRDGALDYLTKPIPFDRLQATAAQVMHRAQQIPVEDSNTQTGDIVGQRRCCCARCNAHAQQPAPARMF